MYESLDDEEVSLETRQVQHVSTRDFCSSMLMKMKISQSAAVLE